jgi:hypothetical protein
MQSVRCNTCLLLFRPHLVTFDLSSIDYDPEEGFMTTPLMFALATLLALVSVPATRELLRSREQAAKKRLVPIRIERQRDYRDR